MCSWTGQQPEFISSQSVTSLKGSTTGFAYVFSLQHFRDQLSLWSYFHSTLGDHDPTEASNLEAQIKQFPLSSDQKKKKKSRNVNYFSTDFLMDFFFF